MTNRKLDHFLVLAALPIFVAVIGCESKSTRAAQSQPSPGAAAADSSKVDYSSVGLNLMKKEALGPVRIGAMSDEVIKALGTPESKPQTSISEVDAQPHQQWIYLKQAVVLDMVTESGKQQVAMIRVNAPSTLKTKRGIGIGSTKDAVKSAYAAEIDPSSDDPQTIIAGTVYGGLIFGLEQDRVASIILGAAAE